MQFVALGAALRIDESLLSFLAAQFDLSVEDS